MPPRSRAQCSERNVPHVARPVTGPFLGRGIRDRGKARCPGSLWVDRVRGPQRGPSVDASLALDAAPRTGHHPLPDIRARGTTPRVPTSTAAASHHSAWKPEKKSTRP